MKMLNLYVDIVCKLHFVANFMVAINIKATFYATFSDFLSLETLIES